jgi:uncharacterized protein involved in exopolysaccharide biosynthesis
MSVAQADSEMDLLTLLHIARGYWLLIGLAAFAGAVIALIYAFTATQIFRAQVVVTEVKQDGLAGLGALAGELGGLAGLAGIDLGAADTATRDAKATLKSRRLAEAFVSSHATMDEIFGGSDGKRSTWRAVERFRKRILTVIEDRRNETLTIAIDTDDAARAARWANAYVALANETIRTRAREESERNISYLTDQISKTDVVEVRRALYGLIENETKTLMIANGRPEYAFTIIDPAVIPELRISPKRFLTLVGGTIFGLLLGTVGAFLHYRIRRQVVDPPRAV